MSTEDVFSRYERLTRERIQEIRGRFRFLQSHIDVDKIKTGGRYISLKLPKCATKFVMRPTVHAAIVAMTEMLESVAPRDGLCCFGGCEEGTKLLLNRCDCDCGELHTWKVKLTRIFLIGSGQVVGWKATKLWAKGGGNGSHLCQTYRCNRPGDIFWETITNNNGRKRCRLVCVCEQDPRCIRIDLGERDPGRWLKGTTSPSIPKLMANN